MGLGDKRVRALYGILHKARGMHRYTRWRWVIGIACTLAIAALPLTRTLRFDLWGGQHYYLGEHVSLVEAARRFAFPFLGINIAIILLSRVIGRYLCGFACPVGSLARLGEWARYAALPLGRLQEARAEVVGPLAGLPRHLHEPQPCPAARATNRCTSARPGRIDRRQAQLLQGRLVAAPERQVRDPAHSRNASKRTWRSN